MMKKPSSFRRFLLIMVFLLEGLSLAVVIGFLFAMLDQSMKLEHVGRVNVQQSELRLYLTNRLNYTFTKAKEIRFNNNIKIGLLVGMHPKITENVDTLYQPTMGSTFYVRSAGGLFFPQLKDDHAFLKNSAMIPYTSGEVIQMVVNPHTYLYLEPIVQQNLIVGHAVGIYDLSADPYCMDMVRTFNDLSLVYKQKEHLTDAFTHQMLPVSSHRITEKLTQKQYQHASDGGLTLVTGMKEFPSLLLTVDNKQYREQRWSLVTRLVFLCLPLFMLTFTISFLILKRITSSLDALAKNALHIAQVDGQSDLDTTKVHHSEFLYFAQAFNNVLYKVRRRTSDLKNANENLQQQIEVSRQMAEALRVSEAQLRSLQDNIPIGLFRRSADGRLLFANPKMVSIFGYASEEEMCRVPIRQVYFDSEQYDRVMEQFEAFGTTQSLELCFKRKDGTPVWGAVHLKRFKDLKSGDVYIDGAFIDITDRKKIEDDKRNLEAQLRQAHKMEALGTLAGGIAHDFNNILFAIIGFCELALEDAIRNTAQRENLQQAITGAQRAAELVGQILTFARQSGIEKHPLNLTAIVKESLKLLRASLPKSIDIITELDGQQTVLADPTQMHQIIVNLCTNAFHAMRDNGGVLTIGLTKIEMKTDEGHSVEGLKSGLYAWLRVEDTGHGMSTETMERIFDPYYTTKAQGDGTGMGLSVVQGIVKGLKGTIRVDSVVGKGSKFNIYLPALDDVDFDSHTDTTSIIGGREHILFVDDELLLTNMVSQMLTNMGYHVTTSNNPADALKLFRHGPEQFDLIISDVTMPEMGGHDMVQEMMKIRPDLPVLLCTGYSENITEKIASNIGVRALMHKPLVRRELSSTIRSVLDDRSYAAA
jgi:PAS domain S-box-containing protein